MKKPNSIVNRKIKSSPPYSTAGKTGRIKRNSKIKVSPPATDPKDYYIARMGKTGNVLAVDRMALTEAEAEAAVEGVKNLAVVHATDLDTIANWPEGHMTSKAFARAMRIREAARDARWGADRYREVTLPSDRAIDLWIIVSASGRIEMVTTLEHAAGYRMDHGTMSAFNPPRSTVHKVRVTVPKQQTFPQPPG